MVQDETIFIEGPAEIVDGHLTLMIPLSVGGDKLVALARGIGHVNGENLLIVLQPWLAQKLEIGPGCLVVVDNANGKLTITRSDANDTEASPN